MPAVKLLANDTPEAEPEPELEPEPEAELEAGAMWPPPHPAVAKISVAIRQTKM